MLPWLAIVKFRVASCRQDEGIEYNPGEPPKVAGPLQRVIINFVEVQPVLATNR